MSWGCPVLVSYQADLSSPNCLSCLVLSNMSCPDPSVLPRLACPSCPVSAVLSQLSCSKCSAPGHLVHCFPDTAVMSWQYSHFCPFHVHLARLTCQADLFRLSCPGCPFSAVLSQLSRPSDLSRLSCPIGPVTESSFNWHDCSILVILS
jgi:hypothetical protein